MKAAPFAAAVFLFAVAGWAHDATAADRIEDLGQPVTQRALPTRCVTRDAKGSMEAWASFETYDRIALIGIRLDNGACTWVDLNPFGQPPTFLRHVQMISAADGNLYAFCGVPGRFVKYDVTKRTLIDLGVASEKASYWLGSATAPDGRWYVGTFPLTELLRCDPATGRIENLGRLSTDERVKYVLHPAVADDGIVYCPLGLHHGELWSFDPKTSERQQILPEALMKGQGKPEVWRARDGRIYGTFGGVKFRCTPAGIVEGETAPPFPREHPRDVGDLVVGDVDTEGHLKLTEGKGKVREVQTEFAGAPRNIYSVSCERDERIYGGTVEPSHSFSYDPATKKLEDLGQLASGPVQVYDTLSLPRGLFISSYLNASVDFFDPAAPRQEGVNPRRVVTLEGQERPVQEILGPDGGLYVGTVPSKGRLGGALLRIDPANFSYQLFSGIVPNESILRLVSLPETKQILGVTTINGGSSAIPTEKEGVVFLWDCAAKKVSFTCTPLPGAKNYGAVVRAANGLVYGIADHRYYVFDPASRRTVHTGMLPVKTTHYPDLVDEAFGKRGLIYGLGDDALFAIDPATNKADVVARDPQFGKARGFCLSHDAFLYFGVGSHLMRFALPAQ